MDEGVEVKSSRPEATMISPLQLHCPSMTSSPLTGNLPKSPRRSSLAWLLMNGTPIASPVKKAFQTMQIRYLEEEEMQYTKLNPQDAWLPITESRNGNIVYTVFHLLNSGIGFQALVLPFAFISLGWIGGIMCLSLIFMWQLYTLWLLVQLHESQDGIRHSRYLTLSMAAFGEKLGKLLALFPVMYLSSGTCVTLIIMGTHAMKTFFQIVCQDMCNRNPLTAIEWQLIFAFLATIVAQFPNLNSMAGVSMIGSLTSVGYCTSIWVVSILKGRPAGLSYDNSLQTEPAKIFNILNALGIIAFAFRGHNLVLEIQGTMPSSKNQPSRLPMWRGVKFAYTVIALCLFPLAIGGYWTYGNMLPENGGMLNALHKYHGRGTSKAILALTSLLLVISSLSSFQIYAMPAVDNLEFRYTNSMNKPCPRWMRSGFRVFFGCLTFFIATALPFLPSLAGLIGGISLPLTLAYPCFMWILLRKPQRCSASWILNWILGVFGMVLSVSVVTGAIWSIVVKGIEIHFFKPE